MWDTLNSLELNILDLIRDSIGCAFLDFFMPVITLLGEDGIFFIAMAVVMLFFKKTRKTGKIRLKCTLTILTNPL